MADFTDITVVSVTGLQGVADGAGRGVAHSANQLPGSHGLLLSPERPAALAPWIRHVAVKPFGYLEYGLFMLYALHEFIETAYALVVQDDGWVLSGANWSDDFFDYDYVGAPVHLARVQRAGGEPALCGGFDWCRALDDPDAQVDLVLNGGFSLRSRRLLQAPRQLGLSFEVPPPRGVSRQPVEMQWDNELVKEDVWLCLAVRERLQQAGMRYAPLEVARRFSIEHAAPGLHDGFAMTTLFGHHSRLRKIAPPAESGAPAMRYLLSRAQSGAVYGEEMLLGLFRHHGWHIDRQGDDRA